MSRIGKLPITIPSTVTVTFNNSELLIKGKFGELSETIPDSILIEQNDGILIVSPKVKTRNSQALHGLYRSLINNMVLGVSEQFKRTLLLVGVGYRAAVQGKKVVLNLGYSHQVEMDIPDGISVEVVKNTTLNLTGCSNQDLGLLLRKLEHGVHLNHTKERVFVMKVKL